MSVNLELSIYSLIIYKIKLHIMIAYSVSNKINKFGVKRSCMLKDMNFLILNFLYIFFEFISYFLIFLSLKKIQTLIFLVRADVTTDVASAQRAHT